MRKGRMWGSCLSAAIVTASVLPAGPATASPAPGGGRGAHRSTSALARTVTLVTGDRVTVSGERGDRIAFTPGKGREDIGYVRDDVDGHVTLTPADAVPMLSSGRLDPRLFDVTTLLDFGYDDRNGGLPLIVTSTASGLRAAGITGARAVRDLPAVGGTAIRRDARDAAAFWDNLTATGGPGIRAVRGDIGHVWLDGKLAPALDVSVPQIGAPAAWRAGYTGKGVT